MNTGTGFPIILAKSAVFIFHENTSFNDFGRTFINLVTNNMKKEWRCISLFLFTQVNIGQFMSYRNLLFCNAQMFQLYSSFGL